MTDDNIIRLRSTPDRPAPPPEPPQEVQERLAQILSQMDMGLVLSPPEYGETLREVLSGTSLSPAKAGEHVLVRYMGIDTARRVRAAHDAADWADEIERLVSAEYLTQAAANLRITANTDGLAMPLAYREAVMQAARFGDLTRAAMIWAMAEECGHPSTLIAPRIGGELVEVIMPNTMPPQAR
jgi:hypothetical protein